MTKAKNFNNCLIYKLVCLDTTYPEVYVGSTTCFKQRKYQHKSNCYNENDRAYNYKIYQYMREHGGFGNFTMIEIEKYPCENGRQLEAREEHWRKELKATLNGQPAFSTDEEKRMCGVNFRNRNPTYMKEYCKEYRQANKEKLKQYYQATKEKKLQYQKEYRQRKKLEKLNQKIPESNIIEN